MCVIRKYINSPLSLFSLCFLFVFAFYRSVLFINYVTRLINGVFLSFYIFLLCLVVDILISQIQYLSKINCVKDAMLYILLYNTSFQRWTYICLFIFYYYYFFIIITILLQTLFLIDEVVIFSYSFTGIYLFVFIRFTLFTIIEFYLVIFKSFILCFVLFEQRMCVTCCQCFIYGSIC